jgi:outer membrane protein OmpA-like peptidoglycan-associated protein
MSDRFLNSAFLVSKLVCAVDPGGARQGLAAMQTTAVRKRRKFPLVASVATGVSLMLSAMSGEASAQEASGGVSQADFRCHLVGNCPSTNALPTQTPAPATRSTSPVVDEECPPEVSVGGACNFVGRTLGRMEPRNVFGEGRNMPPPRQVFPQPQFPAPISVDPLKCEPQIVGATVSENFRRVNACVNFENASYRIADIGRTNLQNLALVLIGIPGEANWVPGSIVTIRIDGHANRTGPEPQNCTLSSLRAIGAYEYLRSLPGMVDAKHIRFEPPSGFCSRDTAQGLMPQDPRNRRIEVRMSISQR